MRPIIKLTNFFNKSNLSPILKKLKSSAILTVLHSYNALTIPIPLDISTSTPARSPNPGLSQIKNDSYSISKLISSVFTSTQLINLVSD